MSGAPLPELAGRRSELSAVRDLLAGSAPRPVLLLAGEAGIGKSRLAAAAANDAARDAMVVLSASCLPLTEAAPLLPVADALRSAWKQDSAWFEAALAGCPAYVPAALATLLPELSADPAAMQDGLWRQHLLSAVRIVLAELAKLRPVALLLEDVHWSDSSTLDLLDHFLHGADGPPVPLLLTFRTDDAGVADVNAAWYDRARRAARVAVLDLPRLSESETFEQISVATGSSDPALAASVFARSEGNPLFTEQLIGSGGALPRDLRAAFDARLSALDAEQLAVVNALAVVGRPLPPSLLAQVLDSEVDVAGAVRRLRLVGLLRSDSSLAALKHALLADAVLADMPERELRKLSGKVAAAMPHWDGHGSPGEIAEHWQRAGDARAELEWRLRAADAAYAAHANRESVHQWMRVISLWDEVPDAEQLAGRPLHEIYLTADWAVFDAGMTTLSIELMDAAMARFADAPAAVLASLSRRQSRNLSWSTSDIHRVAAAMERAQELFDEADEPVVEQLYGLSDATDFRRGEGRYAEALEAADKGLAISHVLGETLLVRRMHAARALCLNSLGDAAGVDAALDDLARAPEPYTLRERTIVATRVADLLLAMGRYAEVPAATHDVLSVVTDFGASGSRLATQLRGSAGEALVALGRLDEAERPEVLGTPASDADIQLVDLQRVEVMFMRGVVDGAERRLTELAALFPDVPDWTPSLWSLRAEVQLWAGNPDAAYSFAAQGLAASRDNDFLRTTGWLLVQAARAAADLAVLEAPEQRNRRLAELDNLHASLAVDDPLIFPVLSPASALRATWEAERARLAAANEAGMWDVAATQWQSHGARFRAAYCRWRQAEAILARRQRSGAAEVLRTAADLGRGHAVLSQAIENTATRARIDLGPVTVPAEPPSTSADSLLTERELAVLRLVAQGYTNAQIGADLFMSPKTASVHVTNILRKLDARSRTQAAAIAERAGLLS